MVIFSLLREFVNTHEVPFEICLLFAVRTYSTLSQFLQYKHGLSIEKGTM